MMIEARSSDQGGELSNKNALVSCNCSQSWKTRDQVRDNNRSIVSPIFSLANQNDPKRQNNLKINPKKGKIIPKVIKMGKEDPLLQVLEIDRRNLTKGRDFNSQKKSACEALSIRAKTRKPKQNKVEIDPLFPL